MILVDVNLLVYAHVGHMPQHAVAVEWLDSKLAGSDPLGMPWAVLFGFVRLVTDRRIFERAEPVDQAWTQVDEWLDARPVWIPAPTHRHRALMRDLVRTVQLRSADITDAHLADLAIEHDLTLASADGGFARFPGLRWFNPLA